MLASVLNDSMDLAFIMVESSNGIYFNLSETKKWGFHDELDGLPGSGEIIDYYEAKHNINIRRVLYTIS